LKDQRYNERTGGSIADLLHGDEGLLKIDCGEFQPITRPRNWSELHRGILTRWRQYQGSSARSGGDWR